MYVTKHPSLGKWLKYSSFERKVDNVRIYGDTAVSIGSEAVVPIGGNATTDKSQTIQRRYTHVWVKRHGRWQLVARQAAIISQQ